MLKLRHLRLPLLTALAVSCACGQTVTPSLGDLAREARAQAAAETKTPPVFTNQNLPHAGDLSLVGPPPAAETPAATAPAENTTATPGAEAEKQWREKFAQARTKLADDSRDLNLTQRELNLAQVQYYSNPNQELQQEYSRANINRLTSRVAALKSAVVADQAALDELGEELRRAGLPPEWGRL